MLVVVFRRGSNPDYGSDRMAALARTMPGYISHKGFFADDGERVTIVEFEHEEGLRTRRRNPEHITHRK